MGAVKHEHKFIVIRPYGSVSRPSPGFKLPSPSWSRIYIHEGWPLLISACISIVIKQTTLWEARKKKKPPAGNSVFTSVVPTSGSYMWISGKPRENLMYKQMVYFSPKIMPLDSTDNFCLWKRTSLFPPLTEAYTVSSKCCCWEMGNPQEKYEGQIWGLPQKRIISKNCLPSVHKYDWWDGTPPSPCTWTCVLSPWFSTAHTHSLL